MSCAVGLSTGVTREVPRRASTRWLDPIRARGAVGDEHGNRGWRLEGLAFHATAPPFRPDVAREDKRPPHDGRALGIVGQRLEAQRLGQRDLDDVAALPCPPNL